MKLIKSLVLGLLGTGVMMAINYIGAKANGVLPLGIRQDGGEYTSEVGFGLRRYTIHAMMEGEPSFRGIRFEPVSFIISVVLLAVIFYIVLTVIEKRKAL